jgi:hypothetical protein
MYRLWFICSVVDSVYVISELAELQIDLRLEQTHDEPSWSQVFRLKKELVAGCGLMIFYVSCLYRDNTVCDGLLSLCSALPALIP